MLLLAKFIKLLSLGVILNQGEGEDYVYLKSLLFSQKSVRPRTEFLMSAVKLQLSIKSQMYHLDILLLRGKYEGWQTL